MKLLKKLFYRSGLQIFDIAWRYPLQISLTLVTFGRTEAYNWN